MPRKRRTQVGVAQKGQCTRLDILANVFCGHDLSIKVLGPLCNVIFLVNKTQNGFERKVCHIGSITIKTSFSYKTIFIIRIYTNDSSYSVPHQDPSRPVSDFQISIRIRISWEYYRAKSELVRGITLLKRNRFWYTEVHPQTLQSPISYHFQSKTE